MKKLGLPHKNSSQAPTHQPRVDKAVAEQGDTPLEQWAVAHPHQITTVQRAERWLARIHAADINQQE